MDVLDFACKPVWAPPRGDSRGFDGRGWVRLPSRPAGVVG
jgi:hypothetical protein